MANNLGISISCICPAIFRPTFSHALSTSHHLSNFIYTSQSFLGQRHFSHFLRTSREVLGKELQHAQSGSLQYSTIIASGKVTCKHSLNTLIIFLTDSMFYWKCSDNSQLGQSFQSMHLFFIISYSQIRT